ncbi:hypothetical protein FGO68_gene6056 [Halteria grandinella]|uniref:Kelch motif family protein n=1 Tax=Halteria grandinella TaxID=5974 RepID=A0A8J8NUM4_HALGN|nr:hypothetical protein FGO68_gene6056 [Halteria grandinella]
MAIHKEQVLSKVNEKIHGQDEKAFGRIAKVVESCIQIDCQQQDTSQTIDKQTSQGQESSQDLDVIMLDEEKLKPIEEIQQRKEVELNGFFQFQKNCVWYLQIGQPIKQIAQIPNLALCKVVPISRVACLVIGGAFDQSSSKVFNSVRQITVDGQISFKAPMNLGRSTFGCSLSKEFHAILVAGGNVGQVQSTSRCEIYDIQKDLWTELPELNEEKCSISICITPSCHAYAFGGLQRQDRSIKLSNSIERLDLQQWQSKQSSNWQLLSVVLPIEGVDFGNIIRRNAETGQDEIIIFGGWSREQLKRVFMLTNNDQDCIERVGLMDIENQHQIDAMSDKDFFLVSGCQISDKQHGFDFVLGNSNLFAFDHYKITFSRISL